MYNEKMKLMVLKKVSNISEFCLDEDNNKGKIMFENLVREDYSMVIAHVVDPYMETIKRYITIPIESINSFIIELEHILAGIDNSYGVSTNWTDRSIWIKFYYEKDDDRYYMQVDDITRSEGTPHSREFIEFDKSEFEHFINQVKRCYDGITKLTLTPIE